MVIFSKKKVLDGKFRHRIIEPYFPRSVSVIVLLLFGKPVYAKLFMIGFFILILLIQVWNKGDSWKFI